MHCINEIDGLDIHDCINQPGLIAVEKFINKNDEQEHRLWFESDVYNNTNNVVDLDNIYLPFTTKVQEKRLDSKL